MHPLEPRIGSWSKLPAFNDVDFNALGSFIARERSSKTIYPAREDVFRCFELTPLDNVKVVILGQDPYHSPGKASGLAFECLDGVPTPSWTKILQVYKEDVPNNFPADLEYGKGLDNWSKQGVLLLNTALTVVKGIAGSHSVRWQPFTIKLLDSLFARQQPTVFLLWGKPARFLAPVVPKHHKAIYNEHPAAACYAERKWDAEGVFSKTNEFLVSRFQTPIDW